MPINPETLREISREANTKKAIRQKRKMRREEGPPEVIAEVIYQQALTTAESQALAGAHHSVAFSLESDLPDHELLEYDDSGTPYYGINAVLPETLLTAEDYKTGLLAVKKLRKAGFTLTLHLGREMPIPTREFQILMHW